MGYEIGIEITEHAMTEHDNSNGFLSAMGEYQDTPQGGRHPLCGVFYLRSAA